MERILIERLIVVLALVSLLTVGMAVHRLIHFESPSVVLRGSVVSSEPGGERSPAGLHG